MTTAETAAVPDWAEEITGVPSSRDTSGPTDPEQIIGGVPVDSTFGVSGDWRGHGLFRLQINLPAGIVISSSRVVAGICELTPQGVPMIGLARMTIHNVVPTDQNAVHVIGEITWQSDLPVRINLVIKN